MIVTRKQGAALVLASTIVLSGAELQARSRKKTPPADAPVVEPKAPAADASSSEKPAHLRIWKISDNPAAPAPLVRIKAATAGKDQPRMLGVGSGRYDLASYTDVPPGATIIEVAAADDKQFAMPVQGAAFLMPGGAATVLVHQTSAGPARVEVIDDAAPVVGDLTIYNFLPLNLGEPQVSIGDILSAKLPAGLSSVRLRGLSRQSYTSTTAVRAPDGRALHWNNEIDFRAYRRASLLIFLDSYDRVRGRIVPDETIGFSH